MAGGSLFHLSKLNIKTIKMGLKFAMDGCPEKIVAFHILNAVPFYELIMQIMKPFARKELKLLVRISLAIRLAINSHTIKPVLAESTLRQH